MDATSGYLNLTCRTLEQAKADRARSPWTRRRMTTELTIECGGMTTYEATVEYTFERGTRPSYDDPGEPDGADIHAVRCRLMKRPAITAQSRDLVYADDREIDLLPLLSDEALRELADSCVEDYIGGVNDSGKRMRRIG